MGIRTGIFPPLPNRRSRGNQSSLVSCLNQESDCGCDWTGNSERQVHGQNDDRSLDEFSRMFVDNDDDASTKRGTTTKEFPPCERYLQGLDYMEEYDENGESFSAGGRGR